MDNTKIKRLDIEMYQYFREKGIHPDMLSWEHPDNCHNFPGVVDVFGDGVVLFVPLLAREVEVGRNVAKGDLSFLAIAAKYGCFITVEELGGGCFCPEKHIRNQFPFDRFPAFLVVYDSHLVGG